MKRHMVFLAACLTLAPATALAQVVFTGPATLYLGGDVDLMTVISTPTVADTSTGAILTGDIYVDLEGLNSILMGTGLDFYVGREFSVGPLPVEVSTFLVPDLKFVNGGGSATEPTTEVAVFLDILDVTGGLYEAVAPLSTTAGSSLTGNGLEYLDTATAAGPWILSPGRDYLLDMLMNVTVSDLPFTAASMTLEFGGISGFDGVEVGLTSTVVPEPSQGVAH